MSKFARDWWATLWESPVAHVFEPVDVPALVRAARLVDKEARGEATGVELSELRQLEDRFGLSPLARRRLQWEIERATPEGEQAYAVDPERLARLRLGEGKDK